MFDLTQCHVERLGDREYRLHWPAFDPPKDVAVFIADNPDVFYTDTDPGPPLLSTSGNEVVIANPDPDVRHYFYLRAASGEGAVLAERRLALQGAPNFRDLGGYLAADGRRLKWGKLFRSGKLSALTNEDTHYIRRLGLTLVCDFRQLVEQELEPSDLAPDGSLAIASLPVKPGSHHSFMDELHNGIIAVDNAAELMQHINRDFVASQMPQYAEMFQLLLAGDQQMLIHCASGKDRTGFGAALILDVLGVDEDLIIHDYMLTNRYLPIQAELERLNRSVTDREGGPVAEEVLRPLLEVRPDYIRACFDEIRRRYRSKQHFYESELNLDADHRACLQERYLH